MFKPLLRTIPTLSGNVKLSCYLNDIEKGKTNDTYHTYIRVANLSPLQNKLYNQLVRVNLLTGCWEHDVSNFYYYYSGTFYDDHFSFNKSDYQILDMFGTNPLMPRNKNYEFGCKRLSYEQVGYQFEFYAPFYIDDINDLPECFELKLEFDNGSYKTIDIQLNDKCNNKKNYLYEYLKRYVNKISDNVIYCLHESKQATYFGIDALKGGLVEVKDNVISSIYNRQQTINNFDYTICEGFKRNHLIMEQIIPISFVFNIDDFLTKTEKLYFKNRKVKITGRYKTLSYRHDFYDFDTNYTNIITKYLSYDKDHNTFIYKYTTNLADKDFPSLKESRFVDYKYTNKLSKTYNRWKLKYSSDDNPYIINMSYAFSNLNNNYNYGEYPIILNEDSPRAVCLEKTLSIPINKEEVDKYENAITEYHKFNKSLNHYISNWFNVNRNPLDDLNSSNWKDIKDNNCFYNGILYNFNKLTYDYPEYNHIDKFGVFAYPSIHIIQDNQTIINAQNCFSISNPKAYNISINLKDDASFYTPQNINNAFLEVNKTYMKDNKNGIYYIENNYHNRNIYYKLDDILKYNPSIKLENITIFDSYELLDIQYNSNLFQMMKDDPNGKFIYHDEISTTVNSLGYWIKSNLYVQSKSMYEKIPLVTIEDSIGIDEKVFGDYQFFIKDKFISKSDVLYLLPDINVQSFNEYQYIINSNVSNNAQDNYFIKDNVKTDNRLWVDEYSLYQMLYDFYNRKGETNIESLINTFKETTDHKTFYAKFLDKTYLTEWSTGLYQSFNKNDQQSVPTLSSIYYRERVIVDDGNEIIDIQDKYAPLTTIVDETKYTLETFIDSLDEQLIDGMFIFNCKTVENPEHIKKIKLDLYFKKNFYEFNDTLYNVMNIESNQYLSIVPLYMYKFNNDSKDCKECFIKRNIKDAIQPYESYCSIYTSSLKPLFTSTYKTELSNKLLLDLFNKNSIYKQNDHYEFNEYSKTDCLIEYNFDYYLRKNITNFTIDELKELFKDTKNEDIQYWIKTSEDLSLIVDTMIDELLIDVDIRYTMMQSDNYKDKKDLYKPYNTMYLNFNPINGIEHLTYLEDFNLYIYNDDKTNKNYVFYLFECNFDNTNYSINMINDNEIIYTFNQINDINLIGDKIDYTKLDSMFLYINPFFKESIFTAFKSNNYCMINQNTYKIPIQYYLKQLNNDIDTYYLYDDIFYDKNNNDKSIYTIKFTKNDNQKLSLNRYFNRIVPYLKKTYVIDNAYQLVYKNMPKLVCDNNIYKSSININTYSPIKYVCDWNNQTHKSSVIKDFYEYERKHFNDNLYYYLEPTIVISLKDILTYDDLTRLESKEECIEQFKNYINNISKTQLDNNEILFLYNKYNVNCVSEAIKIDSFKTQKLYTLTYKFNLK